MGLLLAIEVARPALGAVIVTSSRGAIGAGFTVDWSALGGDLTPVAPPAVVGAVSVAGAPAFSVFSGSTYNADFLPTDSVLALFDLSAGGPVAGAFDIRFATAVAAAGAQVQALNFGPFSGTIEAYNIGDFLLGSFSVSGVNGGNGDDSAIFAGIISDTADIHRLVFSGFGDGAAINYLSVQTNAGGGVPEPGTALMAASGLALLGAFRRRRARSA